MAAKFSFGTMRFDFELGKSAAHVPRESEDTFNLAIFGDFSGRSNRGLKEPVENSAVRLADLDNFEKVLKGLESNLVLKYTGATELNLRFEKIEDFHPDHLLKQIPDLARLIAKRKELQSPATAAAAEAELRSLINLPAPPSESKETQATSVPAESDSDTLGRLLGGGSPKTGTPAPTAAAPKSSMIDSLIKGIVASSSVPAASAGQAAILSAVDLHLAEKLRDVLHHPDFQALEAAWRGLDLVVREFGGEENLKLFLADVSQDEIKTDLTASESLEKSGWAKLLLRRPEDKRFTLCLGLYTCDSSPGDLEMVGRLSKVAATIRASFIMAGSPHLAGTNSFEAQPYPEDWTRSLSDESQAAWDALRKLDEAEFIGLALPRFLLRQPYGKGNDAIESFPFEEMAAIPAHEKFLWANPAILCGQVVANAFVAEGWEFNAGGWGEVGELPVYKFQKDGETEVKPCAEAWLSERAAEALIAKGLIPVLSVKGRDSVRVAALQSLARKPLPIG